MLLPLFAACTKTSHLFTIHPLRYYFFFSTLFIPSTWQYQFWCIPVEGLAAISGFTCAPHKPTSARCLPAIYDCSSYKVKLPNCL